MKIELTSENCILASLSSEDLDFFELTYDKLDYSDEKARRVLRSILDEASEKTGEPLNRSQKLQIEVMPAYGGGCLILFSDRSLKDFTEAFVFDGADALLDLAKALSALKLPLPKSTLYSRGGAFCLAVTDAAQAVSRLIGEFASERLSGKYALYAAEESCKTLLSKNALEVLCGAFAKG